MVDRIKSIEEYKQEYERSINNPESFWNGVADNFVWKKRGTNTKSGDFIDVNHKWFEDAEFKSKSFEKTLLSHHHLYPSIAALLLAIR